MKLCFSYFVFAGAFALAAGKLNKPDNGRQLADDVNAYLAEDLGAGGYNDYGAYGKGKGSKGKGKGSKGEYYYDDGKGKGKGGYYYDYDESKGKGKGKGGYYYDDGKGSKGKGGKGKDDGTCYVLGQPEPKETLDWWREYLDPKLDGNLPDCLTRGRNVFLWADTEGAPRECTIYSGQKLIIPAGNSECSDSQPSDAMPSFFCDSKESCIECNNKFFPTNPDGSPQNDPLSFTFTDFEVEYQIKDFRNYRVKSPYGPIKRKSDIDPVGEIVVSPSKSDGYWVALEHLPPGKYGIKTAVTAAEGAGSFFMDYTITVVDPHYHK